MNQFNSHHIGASPLTKGKTSLLHSVLLRYLGEELAAHIVQSGRCYKKSRDTFLFMEGDIHQHVFFILQGKIKEVYTTSGGDEILRAISEPGYFVALYPTLCLDRTCLSSGISLGEIEYIAWDCEAFATIIREHSELSLRIAILLGDYMESICRKVCLHRKPNSLCRVAGYILSKSMEQPGCPLMHFGDGANIRYQVNIAPIGLAATEVCLARETFSRAISKLQSHGAICNHSGQIQILDIEVLKDISGMS